MSNRLRNLVLNEFSIVRGAEHVPANPEAVALLYKAESNPKEKDDMQKSTMPAATEQKKSLAGQIAEVVKGAIGKGTRTVISTSHSTSEWTEKTDETPGAAAEGGTTVIITDAVPAGTAKTEPAEAKKTEPADVSKTEPVDLGAVIVKAVDPLVQAVEHIDSRLAAVEKSSTGSRALKSAGVEVSSNARYPEFAKFLSDLSGGTPGQKLSKATLTTAGWSYGLNLDEANAFIDTVVDESTLLKKVRVERMSGPKKNIDKIGLGGTVFKKGTPGTDPGDTVSLSGPSQVQLVSKEIVAIVSVGDDVLEDNIEGDAFLQHLLGIIGRAGANELEAAGIHGDTAVADTGILDHWDGWYKLAKANGAHVIEGMTEADRYWPGTAGARATKVLKSLPTKYRTDPRSLAWILSPDVYLDFNDEIASKGFSEAFQSITGLRDIPLRGIQNIQVPLLKTNMSFTYSSTPYTDGTFVMLTDLRNLIVGIQRDVRIEPQRQARKRATDYVVTMRCDFKIENGDAISLLDHAKVK